MMKRLMVLTLALLLAAPACSRDESAPPDAPDAPGPTAAPANVVETLEDVTSPDAQEPPPATTAPAVEVPMPAAARALIDRMLAAYQRPVVFTDEVTVTYRIQADFPEERYTVRYGPGTDAVIETYEQSFYAIGPDFCMVNRSVLGKYLATPLVDDIATMMGRNPLQLVIQSELRYGKPLDKIVRALALGLRGEVRLEAYDKVTDEAGAIRERLTLRGSAGRSEVLIDPETSFIVVADTFFRQPDMPQLEIQRHLDFSPKASDEVSAPIAFDPGKRRPVGTLAELYAPERPRLAVAIGDPTPDFTLHTLEGAKVSSDEMLGSIVVLHFWSSTAAGSTVSLDSIRSFAEDWTLAGKPVQVWPVNTMETGLDQGERWTGAHDYWEFRRLGMPSLFDVEYEVARLFGVGALPVTVVIDPEGRLVESFGGLTETAALLRTTVDAMLEAAAAASVAGNDDPQPGGE